MCLGYCWKDLDEPDLMECIFFNFGVKMWGILSFYVDFFTKKSNKLQKTSFGTKNQLSNVFTFTSLPFN
jgi:hypothetical protein